MFNCETRRNNFETSQLKVATLLRDDPDHYKPLVIPITVTRPKIHVHHKVRKKKLANTQRRSALKFFFLKRQKNSAKIQFLTLLLKVASSRETAIISTRGPVFYHKTKKVKTTILSLSFG